MLVPAGTKFEIVSVADDSAFKEVGYCEVTVKRI
nr:MAG TPA: ADP-ribosyl-(Dinitrogen reductase) hydrolase [Caudoviricetes sp.]